MSTWCPFWLIFFWCGCLTKGEVNSEGTSHTKGKHWHVKLAGLRIHGPLWVAILNSKTIAVLPSFSFFMSTVILWAFVWSCAPSAAQMLDKEQPQPLGWSKDAAWGVLLLQLSLASPSWTEGEVLGRVVQVFKILSHICLDKTTTTKKIQIPYERGEPFPFWVLLHSYTGQAPPPSENGCPHRAHLDLSSPRTLPWPHSHHLCSRTPVATAQAHEKHKSLGKCAKAGGK